MLRRMILTALMAVGVSMVLITGAMRIGTAIDTPIVAFDYPVTLYESEIILADVNRWLHVGFPLPREAGLHIDFVPESSQVLLVNERYGDSITPILYDFLDRTSIPVIIPENTHQSRIEWTTCGGNFAVIDYSSRTAAQENAGAYRLDANTGELMRLAGGNEAYHRAWSPDRCQFVYSNRPEHDRVFIVDVVSGTTYQLPLPFEEASIRAAWLGSSRIGLTVCADEDRMEGCDIFIHDLIAGLTEPILTRPESDFITSASPDGQWITYSSYEDSWVSGGAMMNIQTRRTYRFGTATDAGIIPFWSPDSLHLAVVVVRYDYFDVLLVLDLSGAVLMEYTQRQIVSGQLSWSPNGEWLLYGNSSFSFSLFNVRNGHHVSITPGHYIYLWSPDSQLMYPSRSIALFNPDRGSMRRMYLGHVEPVVPDQYIPSFTDLAVWD
jgi:hypothetical protein